MIRVELQGARSVERLLESLSASRRKSIERQSAKRVGKAIAAEMRRKLRDKLQGPRASQWRSRVRWLDPRDPDSLGTLQVLGQGVKGRANFYPRHLRLRVPARGSPTWNGLAGRTSVPDSFAVMSIRKKKAEKLGLDSRFVKRTQRGIFKTRYALVLQRTGLASPKLRNIRGPSAGEAAKSAGLDKWAETELPRRYAEEIVRRLEALAASKARR